ncbi:MAG: hemolysin family protein [candidate division Zixibacteria bacterium]|nr:hemolysin family protein [candidate division Zixibacteria bacterium]MCI0596477.1 hemolysin family protein [candidate division Zixibacteria bacterium]
MLIWAAMLWFFLWGLAYVISRVSLELFRDSEELKEIAATLSSFRKTRLETVLKNPQATLFVLTLARSLALVLATVFAFGITASAEPTQPVLTLAILLSITFLGFVFFGEALPRYLPDEPGKSPLLRYLWLVYLLHVLFSPFLILLKPYQTRLKSTPEELKEKKEELVERAIESLAESAGMGELVVEKEEKEMIQKIFRLDTTEVKEVMVPRVSITWVDVGEGLEEIKGKIKETGHARFPLCRKTIDEVAGVLYAKDLLSSLTLGEKPDLEKIARPAYFVPETKMLDELLLELKSMKNHLAIVADQYGGTAGMVSLEDILEAIVGDIRQEAETPETKEIEKISETEYLVMPSLSLTELAEATASRLPEEEFDTVGGLIYARVGTLPVIGQKITSNGLEFTVEKVSGQRIQLVRVTKVSSSKKPGTAQSS